MTNICIVEILDYKNIKLNKLDPETRRRCVNALKFADPKAKFLPSVRLGRWDGMYSFCSIGGATYLNHFPTLYPIIEAAGYDFEIVDRRPEKEFSFKDIDKNLFSHKVWPIGHKVEGEKVILNDHQVEAVNALLKNDSGVVQAATSSGKTLICAALSYEVEKYGKSLIIVPNKDLVEQTYKDYVNLGLDVGRVYDGLRELNHTHTIVTWQSLHSINKRAQKYVLSEKELEALITDVQMVIQDEVHLASAAVMKHIHSNLLRNVPLSYGMTGTIPKDDHLRETIRTNFGEVVYVITAKELQELGILSNCNIEINYLQMKKKNYKDYHTEKKIVNTDDDILELVANDIINMVGDTGNTLILVENLETGRLLESKIQNSIFLSGKTKSKDRQIEYDATKIENDRPIIATYGIASTGISINRLFNLVLFNPGKSFVRVIQSIGRGLRTAHDKDFVHIKDYAMNTKYSAKHLTERKSFYKESEYPFVVIKREVN